jgi:FAD synthase
LTSEKERTPSSIIKFSPPPSTLERGSKKTKRIAPQDGREKTNKQSEEEGFKYYARLVLL